MSVKTTIGTRNGDVYRVLTYRDARCISKQYFYVSLTGQLFPFSFREQLQQLREQDTSPACRFFRNEITLGEAIDLEEQKGNALVSFLFALSAVGALAYAYVSFSFSLLSTLPSF